MWVLYAVSAAVLLVPLLLHLSFPHAVSDLLFLLQGVRIAMRMKKFRSSTPIYTILDRFLDSVKNHPEKKFLVFEGRSYSYSEADRLSSKAARALLHHSELKVGDTVALFLGNEPNFVWIWLGLCKLGCTAALLNSNIRSKSLLHCFTCCGAKTLIAGADLQEAVKEVLPILKEQEVCVFQLGGKCDGVINLEEKIQAESDEELPRSLRSRVTMKSPALYIYTSGTTGLPKAALINHERVWLASYLQKMSGVCSNDVIYVYLPLYHSAGFLMGLTGAIERGITVVLRRKFSVSQFWNDCRKYNVTVIQYIGEIMRYLCNTPRRDTDQQHSVRIAIGNGLRADVWREFQRRFGVKKIREFYAASDGNMNFMNYPGKVGAVGKTNFIHKKMAPHALIQYDPEREAPVRDSRGRCVPVPTGEAGLLVCKITAITPFAGYAGNPEDTEKRKLHDVFQEGDVYLNSGDLLRMDHQGFMYFQDRVGDTFRWKGENVATTEVSDIISELDFVEDVCVYGVQVPGHEGRVGMAALTLKEKHKFDSEKAFSHVTDFLPSYARPRFIRILRMMELTGTCKLVKTSLVKEGFDPDRVTPPIYFLQESSQSYIPLTHTLYNDIISGEIHF